MNRCRPNEAGRYDSPLIFLSTYRQGARREEVVNNGNDSDSSANSIDS
jgi:hypothetical protein